MGSPTLSLRIEKVAGSSPAKRPRYPADRGLREAASDNTLSWHENRHSRGLELLFEDGCLRNGVSQWRNRLREIEGSAAGCFFENGEDKTFRKERIARALARSYCHADVPGVAFFPAEVRVPWGSASQVYFSQISLGVEERFHAQTIRTSAT